MCKVRLLYKNILQRSNKDIDIYFDNMSALQKISNIHDDGALAKSKILRRCQITVPQIASLYCLKE